MKNFRTRHMIVLLPFLLLKLFSCNSNEADRLSDFPYAAAESIAKGIEKPLIPDTLVDIRTYSGSDPDEAGSVDFRAHIQGAIDELAENGGGVILLSHVDDPDDWLKQLLTYRVRGPIALRSNIELRLDANIRLFFEFDPEAYLPDGKGVLRRYEGTMLYSFSPLIRATHAENIAITSADGSGSLPVIDGDGWKWQDWSYSGDVSVGKSGRTPAYKQIRMEFNEADVPVRERIAIDPNYHFLRPTMMQFLHCNRIRVEGVKLVNSPFWLVHPVFSRNMIFRNCMFDAQVVNNDGIDIESSSDVLVENIIFDNHDDNVVIKSGRNREGREGAQIEGTELDGIDSPYISNGRINGLTERVVVRNCVFKGHHAFCIGSESSGGARDIYVMDCLAPMEVVRGVFLKSGRERGGTIENIYVNNISFNRVEHNVICLVPNYDNDTISPFPPEFRNINISNITTSEADGGILVHGWEDAPVEVVTIENVTIDSVHSDSEADLLLVDQATDIRLQNVTINGRAFDMEISRITPGAKPPRAK